LLKTSAFEMLKGVKDIKVILEFSFLDILSKLFLGVPFAKINEHNCRCIHLLLASLAEHLGLMRPILRSDISANEVSLILKFKYSK